METSAVLTGVFTIVGMVLSAVTTYMIQKKVAERQRSWGLEDDEKRRTHDREEQSKRAVKEVLLERVWLVEEASGLMASFVRRQRDVVLGEPPASDTESFEAGRSRLRVIWAGAWNNVAVLGSEAVGEGWGRLTSIYRDALGSGVIDEDDAKKAYEANAAISVALDGLRTA